MTKQILFNSLLCIGFFLYGTVVPAALRAQGKNGEFVVDAIERKRLLAARRDDLSFSSREELANDLERVFHAEVIRDDSGKVVAIRGTVITQGSTATPDDPFPGDLVAEFLGGEQGSVQVGGERICLYSNSCMTRKEWVQRQLHPGGQSFAPRDSVRPAAVTSSGLPADATVCTSDGRSCVTTHSWDTNTFFYNAMGASTEQTRGSSPNHLSVSIRWIGYYNEATSAGFIPIWWEATPEGASAPNVSSVGINKWGLFGDVGPFNGLPNGRNWYPTAVCSTHSAGQSNGQALFAKTAVEFGDWYTNGVDTRRFGTCPPNF